MVPKVGAIYPGPVVPRVGECIQGGGWRGKGDRGMILDMNLEWVDFGHEFGMIVYFSHIQAWLKLTVVAHSPTLGASPTRAPTPVAMDYVV